MKQKREKNGGRAEERGQRGRGGKLNRVNEKGTGWIQKGGDGGGGVEGEKRGSKGEVKRNGDTNRMEMKEGR